MYLEEKYIKEGFDDCLAKPIVEEELYYMLRKFLKESEGNNVIIEEKPATNETHSVELLEENRINSFTNIKKSYMKINLKKNEKLNENEFIIETTLGCMNIKGSELVLNKLDINL